VMNGLVLSNFEVILKSTGLCLCTVKNSRKDWPGSLISEEKH
jgi:hypothetical protein